MVSGKLDPETIKVELDAPDDNHTPSATKELLASETNKRMGLAAARFAAMVRLQYLQDKKDRAQRSALVLPNKEDEEREFVRLLDWWNGMGKEKQNNLMLMAEEVARQIHLLEVGGFGL